MSYNNRFQNAPASNNLDPARFAQNPTRTKSTRWTAAQNHNYDGDDWGDDYEDDYNGDIYSSPYQSQQQGAHGPQNGGAYGTGRPQASSQAFSLSRSSTQPIAQLPYPGHQAQEETPQTLTRQGTTPVVPASHRLSSSGIQRKPSKMDRERAAQMSSQQENESAEPTNHTLSGPLRNSQAHTGADHIAETSNSSQIAAANEVPVNEGQITPAKQQMSPTQSPTSGSPTIRRPADIYAAAMRRSSETPADADVSNSVSIFTDSEVPREVESHPSSPTMLSQSQKPAVESEVRSDPRKSSNGVQPLSENSIVHGPPRIEEQPPSPLVEHASMAMHESPSRNSNLFLDINTDDDINRNIKLVTPSPSNPAHFLAVPQFSEPEQESSRGGYESDSDEDNLGLFHTSTPPRRQSLSPTSAGEFGFENASYPVDALPDNQALAVQATMGVSHPRSEAASSSEYEIRTPATHDIPSNRAPLRQQSQPQIEEVRNEHTPSKNSDSFSSFVVSALSREQGSEGSPVIRMGSPAQQLGEQTTSASGSSPPDATAEATKQTPPAANDDAQHSSQPNNAAAQQAGNSARSRENTPDRFEEDEEEEVTIEEARRVEWGMATHVAIPQSQSQSPTKTPTQSPLVAELSHPLITKTTQPTIITPRPTSAQTEQSAIIEAHPHLERTTSPAGHFSSQSSTLSTDPAPPQPSERPSPQSASFAEFIKRSPQSTPTGISFTTPGASDSPVLASVTAPVSFKAFMTSRSNPMPESERLTSRMVTPPISTPSPPAPSFKAFLSQKAPSGLPNVSSSPESYINQKVFGSQENPVTNIVTKPQQPSTPPIQVETRQVRRTEPLSHETPQGPRSEPSGTVSPLDEGEALRQAILKNLNAESQAESPDTPDEYVRNTDRQFGNPQTVSEADPNSPIVGRNPSFKGKMPQRTASIAISDVSEEQYRSRPFENTQYATYPKEGTTKTYPAPPASDISAPSKSGDEPVLTPPTRSVVGEQYQEYEPSIQEEPGYQPSIVSEQYVPSPVDTVHPVKPYQMQRDFNEIPTLLNLSDILALSDSKDRIAASEKARKIHFQQSQQGARDLQVWLQHVHQINHQNAQLWTYNSTRPGMNDLRNNPLISGRFDFFVQQNQGEHHKWNAWGRLDDGVAGSRPSTAASNDLSVSKKLKSTFQSVVPPHNSQRQVSQNHDGRQFGPQTLPGQSQVTQASPSGQPLSQEIQQANNQKKSGSSQIAAAGSLPEVPKDDPPDEKKKSGLKNRLRGILGGRKKDKGDTQTLDSSSTITIGLPQQAPQQVPQPTPLLSHEQPPQQEPLQQKPLPQPQMLTASPSFQSEKYPPNLAQPGSQNFSSNGTLQPQDHQQPGPNKLVIPKQDGYLPPLSFQQGNKSPGFSEVINIQSSNSVPDLRAKSNNQQRKEEIAYFPPVNTQSTAVNNSVQTPGEQQNAPVVGLRRPSTSGAPPPLRTFDDDGPPPLRRISNSKPPPPRKRISSIPASVPEGGNPSAAFGSAPQNSREPQDSSVRPGTAGGHQPPGSQSALPVNLRVQETSSGYEPSVSSTSITSDHASKKSRFSVFNKIKNTGGSAPGASTTQGTSDNTGSPRHSIHTIGSQPSGTTEKRNSSFFQNQLKKFDQLVVGKERANEFHQYQAQQQPQPHPNNSIITSNSQGAPEPGLPRQQSFPVDGSNSIQPLHEGKKKNRFAALISDLKAVEPRGADQSTHEDKKVRKGSFFLGGKNNLEDTTISPVQPKATDGPSLAHTPQNIQTTQNQTPIYNPGQNIVVPIPGQYHSVSQSSQIQAPAAAYANSARTPSLSQPQIQSYAAQHTATKQINEQGPSQNQTVPVVTANQNATLTRKVSDPPPPKARFLAIPPSPPPLVKHQAPPPIEEESIYSPPAKTIKSSIIHNQQLNDDTPPPIRPHQTASPSPPPRIVYAPPPSASTVAKTQPVHEEIKSAPNIEQPLAIETSVFPEQESKVISPITSKSKEQESFVVHPTSFVIGEVISSPSAQIANPPNKEIQTTALEKEEPPRVEITPATAVEPEPPKSEPLVSQNSDTSSDKDELAIAEDKKSKIEEPTSPNVENASQAGVSTKVDSPEPKIASNEDFDKIAVDPEGPVPEEEERIVMSATTMPGFNDWEYF